MQEIMSAFPLIYALLTGLIIAWGSAICIGLRMIMKKVKEHGRVVRRSDKMNYYAIYGIVLFNAALLFFGGTVTQYIFDALIFANFWCGWYFLFITAVHLRVLPKLQSMTFFRIQKH